MKTYGEISFQNDCNNYKVKLLVDTGKIKFKYIIIYIYM